MTNRSVRDAIELEGDSFGRRLRAERERRRISLEAIAANTKIGIALLKGLERDDVSRWPAGIFRRSFMRSYAEAIGLDGEETVQAFLEKFPDPQVAAAPASPDAGVRSQERSLKPVLRLTLADSRAPFSGGRLIPGAQRRLAAAAWDAGTTLALALVAFILVDAFWASLAGAMLCYYLGGILVLGNTPGVCLFAPRSKRDVDLDEQERAPDADGELGSDPAVLLKLDRIRS